jgi:hypothetical protein
MSLPMQVGYWVWNVGEYAAQLQNGGAIAHREDGSMAAPVPIAPLVMTVP